MELDAAKMVGAGLAVIGLGGVGAGIGNIFSSLIGSIARNPAARGQVFGLAPPPSSRPGRPASSLAS